MYSRVCVALLKNDQIASQWLSSLHLSQNDIVSPSVISWL